MLSCEIGREHQRVDRETQAESHTASSVCSYCASLTRFELLAGYMNQINRVLILCKNNEMKNYYIYFYSSTSSVIFFVKWFWPRTKRQHSRRVASRGEREKDLRCYVYICVEQNYLGCWVERI